MKFCKIILFCIILTLPFCLQAQSWDAQNSGGGDYIESVSFISPAQGWMLGSGGYIYLTSNGGTTWKMVNSGFSSLTAIYFVDALNGWAVGATGTIIKTSDGGNTWTAQTSGRTENLFAIYFTDASHGYVVGGAGATGVILKTTDGGTTWNWEPYFDLTLNSVYFIDANHGWAVGNNGRLYHTTNAGLNWTSQTSGTSSTLYGVYFTDINNGWAVGYNGTILNTTNGGTTWVAQTSGTSNGLNSVYFTSVTQGWAVGYTGTILTTANGGSTWTDQSYPTSHNLWGLTFNGANNGWAVGDGGTILSYYSDTWTGGNSTTDWATPANWQSGAVPISTDNVLIPSTTFQPVISSSTTAVASNLAIQNGAILNIATGGVLTSGGNIVVNKGGAITGDYSGIGGTTTLQENIVGQRGWRMFANPFTTATNIAATAATNDITIGTLLPSSNITDSRTYVSNAWVNVVSPATTWAANTTYALFIRGLAREVTGLTYSGGPTAFTYNVSGTLNGNTTSITPTNTTDFILVGNPYVAPVNTKALTGQTAGKNYYTYQIAVTGTPRVNSGSWAASGSTSDATHTIPVLGVIAYQPASTILFSITPADINTGGTLQTGLFGIQPPTSQLELLVEQNGYYQDKMYVRLDTNATVNGTDHNDLKKLYNDNVNVYSIATADNTRLAIDARNALSTIPLGISALQGDYNFKLSSNNLPEGTIVYLNDKLLNTETELKVGDTYSFTINGDASTHGEQRFELAFNTKKSVTPTTDAANGLTANVLGNITNGNLVAVEISGSSGPVNIAMKDMNGKAIGTVNATNGIQYINIGHAVSGMLLLQISDGKSTIIKKIMKL